MKRRIISILMAAVLLLPAAVSLAATNPVVITSEDVRGNVGDTVTATLNIALEPPKLGQTMDSLQFVLEYDSGALEFVGIQEVSSDRINILGAQYMCSVTTKAGAVAFTASATSGTSGSGVLMHIRFKILSAVSTILVLKKVSYSFVTTSSGSQRSYTGGTMNLGRITGQSVPTTAVPMTTNQPYTTPEPYSTSVPTDAPRFPVTEVTQAPGTSPAPEPEESDSDILAYIVFGLFIVVAILICVVLTLMIVRRSQNRAKYFEDDEDEEDFEPEEEPRSRRRSREYEEDPYTRRYSKAEQAYDRDRRNVKKEGERKPKKQRYVEEIDDEEDEPPIRIVRKGKK